MSARVKRKTNHDSVRTTVPEDGHGADGPRALETSAPEPESVDRLAAGGDGHPPGGESGGPPDEPVDELARRRRWELIAVHRSAMETRAKQLCRPPVDPDDLVQDALERALRTQSPLADPTRVRAWLLRIMTNIFIDHQRLLRRLPQRVELDDNLATPAPAEPRAWDRVSADDLRSAIDDLPDDTRETYRLFTVHSKDQATIARLQNIPVATVASRVFRARRRLKETLLAPRLPKRGKDDKGSR